MCTKLCCPLIISKNNDKIIISRVLTKTYCLHLHVNVFLKKKLFGLFNYLEGGVRRVVEHLDGDVADAVERGQPRQVEVRDGERGAAVVDRVVAQQVGVESSGAHLPPHLGDCHVQGWNRVGERLRHLANVLVDDRQQTLVHLGQDKWLHRVKQECAHRVDDTLSIN